MTLVFIITLLSFLLIVSTSFAIYYGYNNNNNSCENEVLKAVFEADIHANSLYESLPEFITYHLTQNQLTSGHVEEVLGLANTSLTDSQLLDPYYNNEKAKYTTDLIKVVYYLGRNFKFKTNETEAKAWVQKQLAPNVTCVKVIHFTTDDLELNIEWMNSYGGIILKQTLTDGGDYYFLVFRGTLYYSEWVEDAKVALTSVPYLPKESKIFIGFNNIYNNYVNPGISISVRNQIQNALVDYNIINSEGLTICGHSLGSAMAMLSAIDFSYSKSIEINKIDLYAIACPAMNNSSTSKILKSNRLFIIQNTKDLVALSAAKNYSLTKLLGLELSPHTSCCFTGDSINPSVSHSVRTYVDAMTKYGPSWVAKSRSGNVTELGEVCSL
jgi:hypothetical protein